jgi:8-amino-7-oxononanoate synthase
MAGRGVGCRVAADPLGWIAGALGALDAAGLRRTLRVRDDGDGLVDLSGNDYLGLAADPRLAAAAGAAARVHGAGAGASRLVTGTTALHVELEQAIARWKGTEDAVAFSSGYLANTGTIAALVGPGDLVVSDALNHASIVDGCRLSRAEVAVVPHGDVDAVAVALRAGARPGRRLLVVVEGVYSMDGDAADLVGLCDAAAAVDAMVMVDDAHGSGVLGPGGRGTPAAQGVADRVHVHLGTLSKAVGAAGGFVAGRADLIAWLRTRARSFVYDTAPAPAVVGAALAGIRLAASEGWRRDRALAAARQLAGGLALPEPAACIVPLVVGTPEAALAASAALEAEGLRVVAIRPPTVPAGTARLRFTTSAALDDGAVAAAVAAIRRALATVPA